MLFKKSLLLFTLALIAFTAHAQTADQVIAGYVSFIGGKHAWHRIKTMMIHGTYDYGGMKFNFDSYAKSPNRYKFIVGENEKYYAQGFNGTRGWKIDAFNDEKTPTILTGSAALSMVNEADVELEDALINYESKGHQAVLEGMDTVEQKVCFKIKFVRKNGDLEYYYFDAETSKLMMKKALSKNPEMQGEWLTTFYSDYRNISGIKVPFNVVRKLNEQVILTTMVEKVILNEPIRESEFEPNTKGSNH
ncbi:MAG TPA: hypothetical protein VFW11_03535 [Cyclobacteriaceae bacterium]|nr:hypothetical protein [Cyclobacteriaceae bacterium]